MDRRILFLAVLGVSALTPLEALASAEMLVRFKNPQDEIESTRNAISALGVRADIAIVNAEEGLVQIALPSSREQKKLAKLLKKSADVDAVEENNLYQTQLMLQIRSDAAATEFAPLTLNWELGGLSFKLFAKPADPLTSKDWALKAIRMSPKLLGRMGVTAAVIDTGVDYRHEDLAPSTLKDSNLALIGYDFAQNVADPMDKVKFDMEGCMKNMACRIGWATNQYLVNPGHGTHCAGHVSAIYNNGRGLMGVGAGSKLIPIKAFYDAGHAKAGQADDAALIKSIDFAIKNGAKVVNASWGMRVSRARAQSSEMLKALERARAAGVIIVVAAGNEAVNNDTDNAPSFPAAYDLDNLIVVAATDSKDKLASFSNYGAKSVHIGAPGVKILSTVPGSKYSDQIAQFTNPDTAKIQKIDWDGTSMAAPLVTGAVALVWSKYPKEDYRAIRNRILASTRRVSGLSGKVATGGVLDVTAAMK